MESKIPYQQYINSSNPIKNSIILNKAFPNIKEFPQKYKKEEVIPDEINIRKIASEYFEELKTLDSKAHEILLSIEITTTAYLSYTFISNKNNIILLKDLDDKLSNIVGNYFKNLEKEVRLHINLFCYLFTVIEKEFVYKHFVDYDINIIYWVILFHDLAKFICIHPYEKNDKFALRDYMHPYKSSLLFIENLIEKNRINLDKQNLDIFKEKYNNFKNLIFDSYLKEEYNNGYIINIKCFDDIIKYIKYLRSLGENNNWFCDAFILIIFHQNLPNNEKYMNKILLTKKQIKEVFDLRLLEMMRIIMVLDSLSYQIFDPNEWVYQINKHLDEVRAYLSQ